jgi:hypothetical protein
MLHIDADIALESGYPLTKPGFQRTLGDERSKRGEGKEEEEKAFHDYDTLLKNR